MHLLCLKRDDNCENIDNIGAKLKSSVRLCIMSSHNPDYNSLWRDSVVMCSGPLAFGVMAGPRIWPCEHKARRLLDEFSKSSPQWNTASGDLRSNVMLVKIAPSPFLVSNISLIITFDVGVKEQSIVFPTLICSNNRLKSTNSSSTRRQAEYSFAVSQVSYPLTNRDARKARVGRWRSPAVIIPQVKIILYRSYQLGLDSQFCFRAIRFPPTTQRWQSSVRIDNAYRDIYPAIEVRHQKARSLLAVLRALSRAMPLSLNCQRYPDC